MPKPSKIPPLPMWGLVALGGAAGASLRHGFELLFPWQGVGWPTGIFIANMLGSLLMGMFLGWLSTLDQVPPHLPPLIGVGFLGGLTTFSTFAAELDELLRGGFPTMAVAYAVISVLVGVLAVRLGWILIRRGEPA